MEKLFRYSKIAAGLFLSIFILQLPFDLRLGSEGSAILPSLLTLCKTLVWLYWFVLIVATSVKKSPLRAPACIGIVSAVFAAASSIIWLSIHQTDQFYLTGIFIVQQSLSLIATLLFIAAFGWLAAYFRKGSNLQLLAVSLAVVPFLLTRIPIFFNSPELYVPAYFVSSAAVETGLYAGFLWTFSKIHSK